MSPRRAVAMAAVAMAGMPGTPAVADVASLVHPMAGTERGGTFPGAATPFGMVQYSPNTDAPLGGGYRYSQPRTIGFAATHLSGPGCAALGDVVSLPTTGPVSTVAARRQESTFSHATEQASPGYYAVTLDASRVRAELSATVRTAWARFTYPPTRKADVIIDPTANFRGARDVRIRIVGDRTVEGTVGSWGYWHACPGPGENRYTVAFSMRFDRPFSAFGTGNGDRLHRARRSASGPGAGAYVAFDAVEDPRPVVSKIGISYVDLPGARRNLEAETGSGFDFDAVRARAHRGWDALLGRIAVDGGAATQRATFYTALYHSLLHPNVFSDADGRYVGFDDRVRRTAPAHVHFTNFSLWDTYRTTQQVVDLVAPEVVGDMLSSLLDDAAQGGWLPRWPYAHYYTNEMVGDPAANVLADGLLKGLLDRGDEGRAYRAVRHNATALPAPHASGPEARTGLDAFVNRGFVPFRREGVYADAGSLNMEYSLNDCAAALMARRLGEAADERYLLRRAKRYRATIDAGHARPRAGNAAWLTGFDPSSRRGFEEGSAAQYTWLAPQDVSGLAAALGGRDAATAALDAFFDHAAVAANPSTAAAHWLGGLRYTPRNEEDLQAPYLYDYLGQPSKTQDVVSAAESLYTTAPNGLPGSDDLGALSGWYVLSAIGLYPATGGDDHYALTSPLFDRIVIDPPRRFYPGGPIVIEAPGVGPGVHSIRTLSLDGRPLATSQIDHGALRAGAHLVFGLGATPDPGWATGADTPRSACAADPSTADVRLGVDARSAGTVRTRLRNAGDAPATRVHLHLTLPAGWSARAVRATPATLAPGAIATVTWRVHAPRAAGPARLRAAADWSSAGARGAALRTFASATAR
jgi:predicted alpha-1,2-mannosidase